MKLKAHVPLLFIILFVGIFFYPTIVQGKLPIPTDTLIGLYHPWRDVYADVYPRGVPFKNFLITDPIRQQIPWRKIVIDQWKSGNIPWWNPYSFSGTPLAANIQAAVFYPLNILFFLFDFKVAWTILIILQPLLAGIFFYAYCRAKPLSAYASLLGATAWSFSGFMFAWMTWGTIGHVALWLPLILLSIDKNQLWLFVTALTLAFLAGHAQIFLYVAILSVAYGIYKSRTDKKVKVSFLLIGLIISLIIASIQWIPFVQLFQLATRSGAIAEYLKPGWLMPWYHIVQFFVPDFYGNPTTLNYWGEWNYGEFIGYIGVIPLLFAFIAVTHRVHKDVRFWTSFVIGSLFILIASPVTAFIYGLGLPVISVLQPTRLMVIVDFSLAMLAAYGFEYWLKNKDEIRWEPLLLTVFYSIIWVIVLIGGQIAGSTVSTNLLVSQRNLVLPTVVCVLSLLILYIIRKTRRGDKVIVVLILGIVIVDLFRFGWKFTPFTSPEYFFPQTKIISYLQSLPKPFRVAVVDERILPPNVSAYYGIETINGYDPLIYAPYEGMLAASERDEPEYSGPSGFNRIIVAKNISSPVIPLLDTQYVLSLDEIRSPLVEIVMVEGQSKLYKFNGELPRVYFEPHDPLGIKVTKYSVGHLTIEYTSNSPRTMIISEINYPGWHATIDDIGVPIRKINGLLVGIDSPVGQHTVRLSYN